MHSVYEQAIFLFSSAEEPAILTSLRSPFPSLLRQADPGAAEYLLSIAFSFVCIALQQFVAARLLGPDSFGAWNVFAILLGFALLSHLGSLHGLSRELPRAAAHGASGELQRLEAAALWTNAAGALLFGAGLLLFREKLTSLAGSVAAVDVLLLSALVLLQSLTNFQIFRLRAQARFSSVARFSMLQQGLILLFVVLLTPRFQITGFLSGWVLAYLTVCVIHGRELASVHWRPLLRISAARLYSAGLPIMLFALAVTINWSLDRLLIFNFLDIRAVGIFSVASFALRVLLYFPEALAHLLYPRWSQWQATADESLPHLCTKSLSLLPWILSVICGLAYYACYLIPVILPQYVDSRVAAQISCVGAPLYGMGVFAGSLLGALRREKLALGLQASLIVIRVALVGGVLVAGGHVLEAAAASTLSGIVFGLVMLSTLARTLRIGVSIVLYAVTVALLTGVAIAATEGARIATGWADTHGPGILLAAGLFLATILVLMRFMRTTRDGKEPPSPSSPG